MLSRFSDVPPAAAYAAAHPLRKSPRLAMALSLFPGLGNVYNGLYLRGLIQFLIVGSLMGLQPDRPRPGQGGLVAGVILTLIGIVAFIEEFINIDLEWLYELWPLALVGIGLWLIVASVRERRKADATEV